MYRETPAQAMVYDYEANAAWSHARGALLSLYSMQATPAVLDIGCHTGDFLGGLPAAWRRFGIESAREPLRVAQGEKAVTVIGGRIEDIGAEWAGKFDAVTMFDVLEHLPNPADGIARAAALVRPGGALIISSGDMDAWTWRWIGAGHWYLQTPQHLSVISRGFLRHVAMERGLRLREFQTIPHRHAPRTLDAARLAYWGMRQRGGLWRIPQRLLHALPGLRDLRHMQSVPWAMSLKDHCVAVLEV